VADFLMPSLGADMETGTVLEWLVHPGDEVHRGDIAAVVDTAKAAVEVEVFDDGVVEEILVPVGREVPVGTPLARLAALGEASDESVGAAAAASAPTLPAPRPGTAPTTGPDTAVPVSSPLVRHLARQRHLDLSTVRGTGTGGAVTRADLDRTSAASREPPATEAPPSPEPTPPTTAGVAAARVRSTPYARRRATELGVDLTTLPDVGPDGIVRAEHVERLAHQRLAGPPEPAAAAERPAPPELPPGRAGAAERQQALRRTIAALMARSKREVPHYYLATSVDLGGALAWLREANRTRPASGRLVTAALLLAAAARACREVPELNGFWRDDRFEPADRVHLGVGIALRGGGLVAPAIHDADRLDLETLMARLADLVTRTRAGRLRGGELSDPTITVTNLGDLGVETVYGVIYPPQVALVGFGRVVEQPRAVDGLLGVRPVVTATLSADHRAGDGHVGARYLTAVGRLLGRPETLNRAPEE
jgi:pyruvate dehydrogenase E2 component (dihydrolipoamide acetyltransferase)